MVAVLNRKRATVHRPFDRLTKVVLVAALSVMVMPTIALATRSHAAASYHQFLVHVNADKDGTYNCGGADWYSPFAFCWGTAAPSGLSYGFLAEKTVTVQWCTAGSRSCSLGENRYVPTQSYVRWMKFCAHTGAFECRDWLLGAVVMPNGPFSVVAGRIDGHTVTPDSANQARFDTHGGPLHLVVNHTRYISNGGGVPSSNGYSFGLIGWLHY